ncbi:hypothetical protein KEJ32_07835 [Candidatus Bathyarchaeota archaeon]|nr:hypothetical protein [Candidatus Bathyarchaeota archaeon]MBS7636321.1 hypothetical protein [Candidatus Bathyarchaeota archaeon]
MSYEGGWWDVKKLFASSSSKGTLDMDIQALKELDVKKMEQNKLDKERLQLLWFSAAEGERFASKIYEMQKIMDSVTREEIENAKKVFS